MKAWTVVLTLGCLAAATGLVAAPASERNGISATIEADGPNTTDYRKAVLEAARWIKSATMQTDKGRAWPAVPGDAKTVSPDLYHGVAGVVLFFLEAYQSTRDETILTDARAGADYLLKSIEAAAQSGLYDGLAGIGFVLHETFRATKHVSYDDGAKRCVQLLRQRTKTVGKGIEWNNSTDIISGSAGIGLFLLYAARELEDEAARGLAVSAGNRLIELGRPDHGGWKWAMNPQFGRLMPNFSHGTAGCAYFLASLYLETKNPAFLDAAVAGAKYLQGVAKSESDGCLIFHHEPDGEDLFYLGWCHGPAGTARLFYRLYQATDDGAWRQWFERSARSVLTSGMLEKRLPGFWNNVSQCCGTAGVAEFCLDVHRVTGDRRYWELSVRLTDDLLRRATRDEKGMRWVQAEHRVQPDLLVAQTGFMQGAAGMGTWLLHADRFARGEKVRIQWPDSPY